MADSVDHGGDRAAGTGAGQSTGMGAEQSWTPDGDRQAEPDPEALRRLAEDWITLWQSELTALAADRETREAWQTTLELWAGLATSIIRAMPRHRAAPHDGQARQPGPDAPPRPAPAAAAPDPRDAEIERLGRHIADLESRLAELERGRRARRPRQPKR